MLLSLFLTVHSSDEFNSSFTEEVGSGFWKVLGNALDKLLVPFGVIVFLGEDSVIVDKLPAL